MVLVFALNAHLHVGICWEPFALCQQKIVQTVWPNMSFLRRNQWPEKQISQTFVDGWMGSCWNRGLWDLNNGETAAGHHRDLRGSGRSLRAEEVGLCVRRCVLFLLWLCWDLSGLRAFDSMPFEHAHFATGSGDCRKTLGLLGMLKRWVQREGLQARDHSFLSCFIKRNLGCLGRASDLRWFEVGAISSQGVFAEGSSICATVLEGLLPVYRTARVTMMKMKMKMEKRKRRRPTQLAKHVWYVGL